MSGQKWKENKILRLNTYFFTRATQYCEIENAFYYISHKALQKNMDKKKRMNLA